MKLNDLFNPHNARSRAYKDHEAGNVPFISSGLMNNGIVGFVKPLRGEKVFNFMGICLSGFCEASVHKPPYLPRGNGGSGLIILEPKTTISFNELIYYATHINKNVKWRFSYGRMITKERIKNVPLPAYDSTIEAPEISQILPPMNDSTKEMELNHFDYVPITEIFDIKSGAIHSCRKLKEGNIPLISCSSKNNGISGFYKIDKNLTHQEKLTVAYDGQPLTVKYHPYTFVAYDNVGVLTPKQPLKLSTTLFIARYLNGEQWRFSYGRKCYKEKLSRLQIQIPTKDDGSIDKDRIKKLVSNTSYWEYFKKQVSQFQNRETKKTTINSFFN